VLESCGTTKVQEYQDAYWAEITDNELYLYTEPKKDAIVEKEIKNGSILFIHKSVGDFVEVYTRDVSKMKDDSYRDQFRYYLFSPNYLKKANEYKSEFAKFYEIPFDTNKSYIT